MQFCGNTTRKLALLRPPSAAEAERSKVLKSGNVASLLEVFDQDLLLRQLAEILRALETDLEIHMTPITGAGTRVRIKHGPLQGVEGWMEPQHGGSTVLLRLDFIGQAAAVKMEAEELELI